MYGNNLREFIQAMFNYDIVWMPTPEEKEPPF